LLILINDICAKTTSGINGGKNISDYFSGLVSLNDKSYEDSFKFLRQLEGLEDYHPSFSKSYIYALINLGRVNEALRYSKLLEKKNINNYESNLIIGVYNLKNKNYERAKKYFDLIIEKNKQNVLQQFLANQLNTWLFIENSNFEKTSSVFESKNNQYNNLNKIQNAFLNCYFDSKKTEKIFSDLVNDNNADFSRYHFFYANYLIQKGEKSKAKKIVNEALEKYPENLILKQFKKDISSNFAINIKNKFDCKNLSNVVGELLYISSNALSSRFIYDESNFYLNLAKYLNPNFISYEALHAENFYLSGNLEGAKKIYKKIGSFGEVYSWYATKQIVKILKRQKKDIQALKLFKNVYNKKVSPDVYETFDYAFFLKNNEKYEEAITYYSSVLQQIDDKHPLYHQATDGRGISFERIGKWKMAEKDFLDSLASKPDQAYVLNYLAYSWIERGMNINKSLKMLERANAIKKNDGYIIDSLGWAYFKLENIENAKKYLQLAVMLMPRDPVVNDHFADALWLSGKKIQARYYWKFVLGLQDSTDELKSKIKEKLINGLKKL